MSQKKKSGETIKEDTRSKHLASTQTHKGKYMYTHVHTCMHTHIKLQGETT